MTERCEIWGCGPFVCVLKFDSPIPEDHRVNILSTADSPRHPCKLGAPPRFPAPVSTEDRIGAGGSSDGQDEQHRIILPPETGEKPSLSSGWSDTPWLNHRRPGSLYSIVEYEKILLLLLLPQGEGIRKGQTTVLPATTFFLSLLFFRHETSTPSTLPETSTHRKPKS